MRKSAMYGCSAQLRGGCFSPDVYEHKHQECWLKHANNRLVGFVWQICSLIRPSDIFSHLYRSLYDEDLSHFMSFCMQADEPNLNFKVHYDEEYRREHPTAPVTVPWVSGIIQA
uniref:Uncharacterized protein n=1 Tax=Physcomitrium patens TaxID=3218 RepID=A0A7I3YWZ3_PHYPA